MYEAGSKVLYVARAQKKSEREQILRRQFEEKRKEKFLKYQVVILPILPNNTLMLFSWLP